MHGPIPAWLAIVWIGALLAVFAVHCPPLLTAPGPRRIWHALHLAMAGTMALMYASGPVLAIAIAGPGWTVACALGAIFAAGMLAAELRRRSVSLLWPLSILDLVAMAYMLSGGHPVAPVSWPFVVALAGQVVLWPTRPGRRLAERAHSGAAATTREVALRPALMLMAASMACMLTAMQLG